MTRLGRAGEGDTATVGSPSERATPATVRGCSEPLNSSTAAATFCSALDGTARTWRGSRRLDAARGAPEDRRATRPGLAASGSSDRAARAGCRRRTATRSWPSSSSRASAWPPWSRTPSRRERSRPSSERRRSVPESLVVVGGHGPLAHPALVQRAGLAQLADRAAGRRRSRYTSARSPRSSVRPQTSQTECGCEVRMSLVFTQRAYNGPQSRCYDDREFAGGTGLTP